MKVSIVAASDPFFKRSVQKAFPNYRVTFNDGSIVMMPKNNKLDSEGVCLLWDGKDSAGVIDKLKKLVG